MMELGRPMGAFKVELLRCLSDPGELRNGGIGVFPIDFESNALRVGSGSGVGLPKHLPKSGHAFSVSCESLRGTLGRPVIHAGWCITKVTQLYPFSDLHDRNPHTHWHH